MFISEVESAKGCIFPSTTFSCTSVGSKEAESGLEVMCLPGEFDQGRERQGSGTCFFKGAIRMIDSGIPELILNME